jgi:hypothetical protein
VCFWVSGTGHSTPQTSRTKQRRNFCWRSGIQNGRKIFCGTGNWAWPNALERGRWIFISIANHCGWENGFGCRWFSGWVRDVLLLSDAGWLKKSLDEKTVKTKPVILTFILALPFLEGLKRTIPFIYKDWSGWRESNPHLRLGKPAFYHWTTPAFAALPPSSDFGATSQRGSLRSPLQKGWLAEP